jgi:tetratricopeptide (TPR) repeat protein
MEFFEQIGLWHDSGEHEKIVEAVEAVPKENREYLHYRKLARALNNLDRHDEAIAALDTVKAEGESDPLWWYVRGYALIYAQGPGSEEAAAHFRKVLELDETDENAKEFLSDIENYLERDAYTAKRRAAKKPRDPNIEPFDGFDFTGFWDDDDYALKSYVEDAPTDETIAEIEAELGYKLPKSYIWLMKRHNGGIPVNTCYPTEQSTSWAKDHVAITGIMGIGRKKNYSLCGDLGSRFMIEEWGYPDIGVAICDCPSAGHDMIFLDYSACGPEGEPDVVHIDQESDYEITYLADDFESFIRGLVNEETFEEDC